MLPTQQAVSYGTTFSIRCNERFFFEMNQNCFGIVVMILKIRFIITKTSIVVVTSQHIGCVLSTDRVRQSGVLKSFSTPLWHEAYLVFGVGT